MLVRLVGGAVVRVRLEVCATLETGVTVTGSPVTGSPVPWSTTGMKQGWLVTLLGGMKTVPSDTLGTWAVGVWSSEEKVKLCLKS